MSFLLDFFICRLGADKISEENIVYLGETPKLNFIYDDYQGESEKQNSGFNLMYYLTKQHHLLLISFLRCTDKSEPAGLA